MRETELKAVVPDEPACLARLLAADAVPVAGGRLEDRRYDLPDRRLASRDTVLRLRTWREAGGTRSSIDFKGAATVERGYKHRDETSVTVGDGDAMAHVLAALGYVVTREIDRDVQVLRLGEATCRFERFARMDTLLEVEGTESAIEAAIAATGIPRDAFTAGRLFEFIQRFEARTGQRAAICDREARGEYPFAAGDA